MSSDQKQNNLVSFLLPSFSLFIYFKRQNSPITLDIQMPFELFPGAISIADATVIHPSTSTIAQVVFPAVTIPENTEDYLFAIFEVAIEQDASTTAQTLTFNITDGATVIKAYPFKVYAALKYDIVTFWAIFTRRTKSSIQLQLATAGSADASHVNITGKNMFVASVTGGVSR